MNDNTQPTTSCRVLDYTDHTEIARMMGIAPTLVQRTWIALARFDLDSKRWRGLVDQWRDCVERFGPESAPATGSALALVRAAWPEGWHICMRFELIGRDRIVWVAWSHEQGNIGEGATEPEALVSALEAAI